LPELNWEKHRPGYAVYAGNYKSGVPGKTV
jgi:hypothetical protein